MITYTCAHLYQFVYRHSINKYVNKSYMVTVQRQKCSV